MSIVSPSILSASFSSIHEEVNKMTLNGAKFIHLDVMDGKFVPNTTFDASLLNKIKDIDIVKVQAQTEDYIEKLRIQREESQYAQHKQTQTMNIGAFQIEKQAKVGIAGAEALGQMGTNGAGDINLDSNSGGFNLASAMASMAVGGAVGQNIAGSMNNMMSGMNQPIQQTVTPPPLNNTIYYVAVNGQATGPFDMNTLSQMVVQRILTKDTLVWKEGMQNWTKVVSIEELKNLFVNVCAFWWL